MTARCRSTRPRALYCARRCDPGILSVVIAFIFPGQGSHFVGMGKDLVREFSVAAEIYERAEALLDIPLRKLSFDGPERILRDSEFAQPAIFVHSVVLHALLIEHGIQPSVCAGHSLGEIAALHAAGCLDLDTGLSLVKARGKLMGRSGECSPGKMTVIVRLETDAIRDACEKASALGQVVIANDNCPGNVVIAGEPEAVDEAGRLCLAQGATRTIPLAVSGAFHSPLMLPAAKVWQSVVSEASIKPPTVRVIGNVTASDLTSVEEIRQDLIAQLTAPVRWRETMEKLWGMDLKALVEVGPGKTLKGLALRWKGVRSPVHLSQSCAELHCALAALGAVNRNQ